jgi:hypothetical protein
VSVAVVVLMAIYLPWMFTHPATDACGSRDRSPPRCRLAFAIGVVTDHLPRPAMLVAAGYWGTVASAALVGFVLRGWFGPRAPADVPAVERRAAAPAAAAALSPDADAVPEVVPAPSMGAAAPAAA